MDYVINFWALCAISAHLNVIAKHPWTENIPFTSGVGNTGAPGAAPLYALVAMFNYYQSYHEHGP